MRLGSEGYYAAWKSGEERMCFGSGEAFEDHADWMRRASRMLDEEGRAGRGVKPCDEASLFRVQRGKRDTSGRLRLRRHGSPNTGMAAGVKPRSREAVRVLAQGFTRDDGPGEDEWWPRACELAVAV
jgi:hypothetical protein